MDSSDSDVSEETDRPRDLEEENRILRRNLDDATSKIMKLKSAKDQITDVQIGERVDSLQDAIQWWVNSIDQELRRQSRDFRTNFHRLSDRYGLVFGSHGRSLYGESIPGEDAEWMSWLGKLSTCIYIILSRQIWVFLYSSIFCRRYPIGVSADSRTVFDDIFSVMKVGAKDKDTVILANKWRSDTIKSLVETRAFRSRKSRCTDDLCDGLEKTLRTWLDVETLEPHFKALKEKLIRPAIDLHQEIACSSYEYVMSPPDLVRGETLDELDASSWIFKDVVKWRPPDGEIAGVFQCLYPGIYRREILGDEPILAAAPVVLVYDCTGPQPPRGPTRRSKAQRSVQQNRKLDQSPKRSTAKTPQRSPRRSPERPSQGPLPPSPAPAHRSSTFPRHEDTSTARRTQEPTAPSILESSAKLFGMIPVKKQLSKDKRPGDRSSDSTEDARRPTGSKSASLWNRTKTPTPPQRSNKSAKQSKQGSRSRRQSISMPSSPAKQASISKTGDSLPSGSAESAMYDYGAYATALYDEPEPIRQHRRDAAEAMEYELDNEIVIDENGASVRRFVVRTER